MLTTFTQRTVGRIAEQPPSAVRAVKSAVSATLAPMRDATRHNDRPAVSLDDFRLGIATFLGCPGRGRALRPHQDYRPSGG